MREVEFLPAARVEFLDACGWYGSGGQSQTADFVDEVERAVRRITSFPDHGSPYFRGTRRILLRQFPFSVVRQSSPDGAVIVALAHHSRRPGYWRGRIRWTEPEAAPAY